MKKLLTVLLACAVLFSVSACSRADSAAPGTAASSVTSEQSGQGKKAEASGKLTEKEALRLVREQALKEYNNEDTEVDEESGQILDQNDTAYLIGFDLDDQISGNHLYTEAYWISKSTRQIKDVCSINEYYEGLIDLTTGESNF